MNVSRCFISACLFAVSALLPSASAQPTLLRGLGLEGSLGFSGLAYTTEEVPGTVVDASRTAPYFTPSLRLHYNRRVYGAMHVMPFIAYSAFGGRSAPGDISDSEPNYEDSFRFQALEAGAFFLYEAGHFQFGPGLKLNRHLEVTQRARIRSAGPGGLSDPFWITTNFDFLFDDWSFDGGLRAEYEVFPHVVLATEGWLGLSRLERDLHAEVIKIRSRHLRLTLPCRL